MILPLRFTWYISRQFLKNLFIVLAIIGILILLFDSLEIIRRTKDTDINFISVLYLSFLRLPSMVERVIPFAVLLGAVFAYTKLAKTSELVVIRAAGISVWQFLLPAIASALLLGIFMVAVFNPISCAFLSKYESVSSNYFKGRSSFLSLSPSGLWLRQKDPLFGEKENITETVLHARNAKGQEDIVIHDIIIYMYGENDRFVRRIDAERGQLVSDYWHLYNVVVTERDNSATSHQEYFYRTDLTLEEIFDSLTSPESISFWELPRFIHNIQDAGFSAIRHRLHFQKLIALPIFFLAMVLIGAVFSLQPPRSGRTGLLITASIVVGFLIYFATNLIASLGLSGSIPVPLAVWTPIVLSGMAAMIGLLHFEDG